MGDKNYNSDIGMCKGEAPMPKLQEIQIELDARNMKYEELLNELSALKGRLTGALILKNNDTVIGKSSLIGVPSAPMEWKGLCGDLKNANNVFGDLNIDFAKLITELKELI